MEACFDIAENIGLFDVQTGFGGAEPGNSMVASEAELIAEMARLGIGRALVREVPDTLLVDVPHSNEKLYAAHERWTALVPCPIVLPNTGADLDSEAAQLDAAIQAGAGAVTIRPEHDHWSLAPWACEPLFRALEERRMPVLCMHDKVTFDELAGLAERYPRIPFILAGIGYRTQRIVLPLLDAFPNVYLSLGSNMTIHLGVEQLVATVGPERLLFGTGFPQVEAMCGITLLMYAEISSDAKALIGAGNLIRLLAAIRR